MVSIDWRGFTRLVGSIRGAVERAVDRGGLTARHGMTRQNFVHVP